MNQQALAQNTTTAVPAAPAASPGAAAPAAVAGTAVPVTVPGTPVALAAPPAAPGAAPLQTTSVGAPQQPQGPTGVAAFFASPIFLLILMFVVFYFLLIRPQQKKAKEHTRLLSELKKGDEVLLASGIFGKIAGLTDTWATIEIADKVRIKVLRTQIAGLASAPQTAQNVGQAPAAEQK